jgi:hypothetical protein
VAAPARAKAKPKRRPSRPEPHYYDKDRDPGQPVEKARGGELDTRPGPD